MTDEALELPLKLREAVFASRENWKGVKPAIDAADAAAEVSYAGFSDVDLRQASYFAKQGGNLPRVQRIAQELVRRRMRNG
jgi:hypothetical protein